MADTPDWTEKLIQKAEKAVKILITIAGIGLLIWVLWIIAKSFIR